MFFDTIAVLEKFDNSHDFERMCAEILIAQGYKEVELMAPRGGKDEGQDITFRMKDGSRGLVCCTLRKDRDIDAKFREDFSQRKPDEYTQYILFCTAYLSFEQKKKYATYCLDKLNALFFSQDIEALRGLLDNAHQDIRERFLHIPDQSRLRQQETLSIVENRIEANNLFQQAKQEMAQYDWEGAEYYMDTALQLYPLAGAPGYFGVQMSAALTDAFKREHDLPPGYRFNAMFYDTKSEYHFFAPRVERAIYWLEYARKQNENTNVEVLQELGLMYGFSKNYDEMLSCVKEAISLSPTTSRPFFKESEHLAILAYGCVDELDQPVALKNLGEELKLKLPVSPQEFQQSINALNAPTCWIVMGVDDAWVGRPKPDFPIPLWILVGEEEGLQGRIAKYRMADDPGRHAIVPPDGKWIPLDELISTLAKDFLFICHQPANTLYTS